MGDGFFGDGLWIFWLLAMDWVDLICFGYLYYWYSLSYFDCYILFLCIFLTSLLLNNDHESNFYRMKSKIKTLNPDEFLTRFMTPCAERNEIFKENYGRFYIATLQDLRKISTSPVPPVRAQTHTLIYLTSGVLIMKIGFHSIKIYKNECAIIPAGQVLSHQTKEDEEDGTGFMCGFESNFLIGQIGSRDLLKTFEFLTIWGNPIIKLQKKTTKYLAQSLQRIWDEYQLNGLKNALILQAHLIALLCDLNTDYQPLSTSKNKTAVALTNQFKELLHKNIRTHHLVADYASMLNVSPNHLTKTIKLITQKSPSKWIGETLVTEAKVLLFQSNQSISEIAFELGIDDQSYFSRLFKKYEGVSPLAFRKMID